MFESMKVKLLRKWNLLMDFLFIGDFISQMSLMQKIRWAWSCVFNRELRRLAYQAYKEFNDTIVNFIGLAIQMALE